MTNNTPEWSYDLERKYSLGWSAAQELRRRRTLFSRPADLSSSTSPSSLVFFPSFSLPVNYVRVPTRENYSIWFQIILQHLSLGTHFGSEVSSINLSAYQVEKSGKPVRSNCSQLS
ncbi:uncharacterized protein LOC108906690, partial [Anoplophora glabripennis]|uniref:uncharacterized protein LOC108906690 n=1 Tax=Anoplophora glabripennis TaxID=217634 RepID=UPI000874331E